MEILRNLKERAEEHVKLFDAGTVMVVGTSDPILANLEYSQTLHAQILDLEEAIELLNNIGSARHALSDEVGPNKSE